MSDNSLEVVESNASEPVIDVKETDVQEETKVEEASEVEEEVTEEAEPEKKLTKAEQVKQEYEERLTNERAKFQKRIDTKTAIEKQEREKRMAAEKRLEEFEQQAPQVDDAPNIDTFEGSLEEFIEARDKYVTEKAKSDALREAKQAEVNALRQREYERGMKEFAERETKFREANPDYDENAKLFGEQISYLQQAYEGNQSLAAANEMLLTSDVAPAIINTLAKDPDLAESWANLSPAEAAREVFKLEQTLSVPNEVREGALPKPVKTLKGTGSTSKPANKMSGEELLKKYNVR